MDLQSLSLSKKYSDGLALGFSSVSDMGNGVVRFELTDGTDQYVDVQVPTVKGDTGEMSVGTVTSGETPSITNVGTSTDAILNFVLPKGDTGNSGEIEVGEVTSGTTASVTNSGTSTHAIFDFVLPKGAKGDKGDKGDRGASTLQLEVVEELPTTGDNTTIYLKAKETPGTQNLYDEYVWNNGEWEKIGDTQIDLSNYYTKQEIDTIKVNDVKVLMHGSVGDPYGYEFTLDRQIDLSEENFRYTYFDTLQNCLISFYDNDGTPSAEINWFNAVDVGTVNYFTNLVYEEYEEEETDEFRYFAEYSSDYSALDDYYTKDEVDELIPQAGQTSKVLFSTTLQSDTTEIDLSSVELEENSCYSLMMINPNNIIVDTNNSSICFWSSGRGYSNPFATNVQTNSNPIICNIYTSTKNSSTNLLLCGFTVNDYATNSAMQKNYTYSNLAFNEFKLKIFNGTNEKFKSGVNVLIVKL